MPWLNTEGIKSHSFDCGYCGNRVASVTGYRYQESGPNKNFSGFIALCPHCSGPTYFTNGKQRPGVRPGEDVGNLPKDIKAAYDEARDCMAASAHTAAAMLCRKLLMHLAVAQGAPDNLTFKGYVEHLAAAGYVPPNGKAWVDHIRDRGNEANHDLVFVSESDAADLIGFAEMLLKFIYEFPMKVGAKPRAPLP